MFRAGDSPVEARRKPRGESWGPAAGCARRVGVGRGPGWARTAVVVVGTVQALVAHALATTLGPVHAHVGESSLWVRHCAGMTHFQVRLHS